jgi:hypothetical protein
MINVNKVYRSVLSIINKEQRGYLTPDQFNKIARQVQLDIFENTFYEYNRSLNNNKSFKINDEYANTPKFIKEKIDLFSTRINLPVYKSTRDSSGPGVVQLPSIIDRTQAGYSNVTFKLKKPTKEDLLPVLATGTNSVLEFIENGTYGYGVAGTFNSWAGVAASKMILSSGSTDILEKTISIPHGDYEYKFIVGEVAPNKGFNSELLIVGSPFTTTFVDVPISTTYTNRTLTVPTTDIVLPLTVWSQTRPEIASVSPIYKIVGLSTIDNNSILEASKSEIDTLVKSKLTKPTTNYPIYCRIGENINVYPNTVSSINIDYIRKPLDPKWGYNVAGVTGNYQYNPSTSVDFEIHPSDETTLIINILQYAGVAIKDADIVNVATAERANKTTTENQ